MMRGGLVVLALLGSAGAFIASPTIGPLARRGFVAPSAAVVPNRACPVAINKSPEESSTSLDDAMTEAVCPGPDVPR